MNSRSFSLAPIQDDIRQQIKVTHQIFDAIERLGKLADATNDPVQKSELERIMQDLAGATNSLTKNAAKTSDFVVSVAT